MALLNTAQLIGLAVQLSMAAIVFAIGLKARPADAAGLLRRPGLLLRSVLAMNVIVPVSVAAMCVAFELHRPVAVALIALAVSPIPPILPNKMLKAGGEASYDISILVWSTLAAIVTVPLSIAILGRVFERPLAVPAGAIAGIVASSALLPLLAGMVVRRLAPALAERGAHPVHRVGVVVLVLAFVPVLLHSWHTMVALLGHLTLVAIVAMVVIGLACGHVLGGPRPDDRTVLALASSARHPSVAVAVGHALAPDDPSVVAAVLLAFIVSTVVATPYVRWRAGVHARGNSTRLSGDAT